MRYLNKSEPQVDIELSQCSRFPVFKNISHNWSYDYKGEEKKRFRGSSVWDPTVLIPNKVDEYLRALQMQRNWRKAGLSEETALLYLAQHDYRIDRALCESEENPNVLRQMVVKFQKQHERIELFAYIGSLVPS